MGAEFVVDAALGSNPKFKDLAKRLAGPGNAMWALIRLWAFAANHRPDGDFVDIDPAEVPLTEIEWAALLSARGPNSQHGFLELVGGTPKLHHWDRSGRHQGSLERRRQAAKIAGKASAEARQQSQVEEFSIARAAAMGRDQRLKEARISTGSGDGSNERSERSLTRSLTSESGDSSPGIPIAPNGTSSGVSDMAQNPEEDSEAESYRVSAKSADTLPQNALFAADTRPPRPQKIISEGSKAMERWLDDGYEWFYSIYPRHVARESGRKAWGQLHRTLLTSKGCRGLNRAVWQRIAKHVQRMLDSGEWEVSVEGKKHIPYPATYLNQQRWEE